MPHHTFTLNGSPVTVDAPDDLALLWVLRDKLGVRGPKYGCGINVCRACTSHLGREAFNPCVTPVSEVGGREVTTIEGLADDDIDAIENVCRCGSYVRIREAIKAAAAEM